jgi:hypothetical protein
MRDEVQVPGAETLVPWNHPARVIHALAGQLDLSEFDQGLPAGRARLLLSVWLYAFSEGIGSARGIQRQRVLEPGLLWLSAMDFFNRDTLADFRLNRKQALDKLFEQLLAALDEGGLIDLSRLLRDRTKARAKPAPTPDGKTTAGRLELARALLQAMGDPRAIDPGMKRRREAARKRAAREQVERLESALARVKARQLSLPLAPAGFGATGEIFATGERITELIAFQPDRPTQRAATVRRAATGVQREPLARVVEIPSGSSVPRKSVKAEIEAKWVGLASSMTEWLRLTWSKMGAHARG